MDKWNDMLNKWRNPIFSSNKKNQIKTSEIFFKEKFDDIRDHTFRRFLIRHIFGNSLDDGLFVFDQYNRTHTHTHQLPQALHRQGLSQRSTH